MRLPAGMVRPGTFAIALLILASAFLALSAPAMANDQMFPAVSAAAGSIGWKDNYFVINGTPTFLTSGSIRYARIPQEEWRERLLEAKRGGLNTIQSHVFWNAHEPQENVFDFTYESLDLDAMVDLEEVGLYALIRLGPSS